ncbi:hypothetical protein EDD22DRAFT_499749 [Suillus occidentalis]|nr:hypothetical protein EDD22DRAFT_499749 [Suillus occidentalis]
MDMRIKISSCCWGGKENRWHSAICGTTHASESRKPLNAGANLPTNFRRERSYRSFLVSACQECLSMNLPHLAFTSIATPESRTIPRSRADFSAVTTYHALPCSFARNVFTYQSFLQLSNFPGGELHMALHTFLDFARGAGSLLDFEWVLIT